MQNQDSSAAPGNSLSDTVYEQPLGERTRNFLRLEHLFTTINQSIPNPSCWSSRHALSGMIEINDLLARTDIKAELIKELERHSSTILSLSSNPNVDQNTLREVVEYIEHQVVQLKSSECQPSKRIRNDELVNQVRQRINIPGGACSFDLPAFHHWLNQDFPLRAADLNSWMEDLRILESGIHTILSDIRDSATRRNMTADGGFYQQHLDASVPCQLLRVSLPGDAVIFPEISGGKHRFTIRFLRQDSTQSRPEAVTESVAFGLQCCGI